MSYPDQLEDLCDDIHDWQLKTFPCATVASKIEHLRREVEELSREATPGEIADCLMLLIGIAKLQNVSILGALRDKLRINKSRTWGEPDALGVVEHVEQVNG